MPTYSDIWADILSVIEEIEGQHPEPATQAQITSLFSLMRDYVNEAELRIDEETRDERIAILRTLQARLAAILGLIEDGGLGGGGGEDDGGDDGGGGGGGGGVPSLSRTVWVDASFGTDAAAYPAFYNFNDALEWARATIAQTGGYVTIECGHHSDGTPINPQYKDATGYSYHPSDDKIVANSNTSDGFFRHFLLTGEYDDVFPFNWDDLIWGGSEDDGRASYEAVAILTAPVGAGTVGTLECNFLSLDLEQGDQLLLTDVNGTQITFTVAAAVQASDTNVSISVDAKTVPANLPGGAAITLPVSYILEQLRLLSGQIGGGVESVAGGEVIATTSSRIAAGSITQIPVDYLDFDLEQDDGLLLFDENGGQHVVTVSADTAAASGQTTIPVNPYSLFDAIAAGSDVMLSPSTILAQLRIAEGMIEQSVEGTVYSEVVGSFRSALPAGTITSLPLDELTFGLENGDELMFIDNDGNQVVCSTTQAVAASTGSVDVPISAVSVSGGVEAGAHVWIPASTLLARLRILAGEIDLLTTAEMGGEVIGQLDAAISGGSTISSITLSSVARDLDSGTQLMTYDTTGEQVYFTLAEAITTSTAAVTVQVEQIAIFNDIAAGQGLIIPPSYLLARLRIVTDEIAARVEEARVGEVLGRLQSQVTVGTITSLPLTGLAMDLAQNDQVMVQDANNAQIIFTVSGDVASSSTQLSVPVVPKTISTALPADKQVFIPLSYIYSQLMLTKDKAELAVAEARSAERIGETSQQISSGVVNSVPLSSLSIALKAPESGDTDGEADRLLLFDTEGNQQVFKVTADAAATTGAVTVQVEAKSIAYPIPAQAPAFLPPTSLLSKIRALSDQVDILVSETIAGEAIAAVDGEVAAGTITSLPVTNLSVDLQQQDRILVRDDLGQQIYMTVAAAISTTQSATTIQVESVTLSNLIPSGQFVYIPESSLLSRIRVMSGQIDALVANEVEGETLGAIASNVSAGAVGSLPLDRLGFDLEAGDKVLVRDDSGAAYYFSVGQDTAASASPLSLPVVSQTTADQISTGAIITLPATSLLSRLRLQAGRAVLKAEATNGYVTNLAIIELEADMDGSSVRIGGDFIQINGDTEFSADTDPVQLRSDVDAVLGGALAGSTTLIVGGYLRNVVVDTQVIDTDDLFANDAHITASMQVGTRSYLEAATGFDGLRVEDAGGNNIVKVGDFAIQTGMTESDETNLITNPDFVTGDLTGWTEVEGAGDLGQWQVNSGRAEIVLGSGNSYANSELVQTISATTLQGRHIKMTVNCSTTAPALDSFRLEIWNEAGTQLLGKTTYQGIFNPGGDLAVTAFVPNGEANIQLRMAGYYDAGGSTNQYNRIASFDNVRLDAYVPSAQLAPEGLMIQKSPYDYVSVALEESKASLAQVDVYDRLQLRARPDETTGWEMQVSNDANHTLDFYYNGNLITQLRTDGTFV